MKRIRFLLACAALLLTLAAHTSLIRPAAATTKASVIDWTEAWADEFSGPNGSGIDTSKWNYDVGGAWGNGAELEYYTNRLTNSSIENGNLQITALRESYLGNSYTSARIQTQRKFSQAYGRIEARIKIPAGKGIWPAFWMLGDDIDTVGWPACGEIDIMEHINNEASIYATVHMPSVSGDSSIGAAYSLPQSTDFSTDFHVFAVEWEPDTMRFYVDNTLIQTVTRNMLSSSQRWVFDHPFFLVLNVAVGGTWPGYPDATTPFPSIMQVDYVRVYTRNLYGIYLPLARFN